MSTSEENEPDAQPVMEDPPPVPNPVLPATEQLNNMMATLVAELTKVRSDLSEVKASQTSANEVLSHHESRMSIMQDTVETYGAEPEPGGARESGLLNRRTSTYKGKEYSEQPPRILINGDTIKYMSKFTDASSDNILEHLLEFESHAAPHNRAFWVDLLKLTLGTDVNKTITQQAKLLSYGEWSSYDALKKWLRDHYVRPQHMIEQLSNLYYIGKQRGSIDEYFTYLNTKVASLELVPGDHTLKTIALHNMDPKVAAIMKAKPDTYTMTWGAFCHAARLESEVLTKSHTISNDTQSHSNGNRPQHGYRRHNHTKPRRVEIGAISDANDPHHNLTKNGRSYESPWMPGGEKYKDSKPPCPYCKEPTHGMRECGKLWLRYYGQSGFEQPKFVKDYVLEHPDWDSRTIAMLGVIEDEPETPLEPRDNDNEQELCDLTKNHICALGQPAESPTPHSHCIGGDDYYEPCADFRMLYVDTYGNDADDADSMGDRDLAPMTRTGRRTIPIQTKSTRVDVDRSFISMAPGRGRVIVNCLIDGAPCKALIDSGAGVTGISREFYMRSAITTKPTPVRAFSCRSVTGEVINTTQQLEGVQLKIGAYETKYDLLLLPISKAYELLIGSDFMIRNKMKLDFDPNAESPLSLEMNVSQEIEVASLLPDLDDPMILGGIYDLCALNATKSYRDRVSPPQENVLSAITPCHHEALYDRVKAESSSAEPPTHRVVDGNEITPLVDRPPQILVVPVCVVARLVTLSAIQDDKATHELASKNVALDVDVGEKILRTAYATSAEASPHYWPDNLSSRLHQHMTSTLKLSLALMIRNGWIRPARCEWTSLIMMMPRRQQDLSTTKVEDVVYRVCVARQDLDIAPSATHYEFANQPTYGTMGTGSSNTELSRLIQNGPPRLDYVPTARGTPNLHDIKVTAGTNLDEVHHYNLGGIKTPTPPVVRFASSQIGGIHTPLSASGFTITTSLTNKMRSVHHAAYTECDEVLISPRRGQWENIVYARYHDFPLEATKFSRPHNHKSDPTNLLQGYSGLPVLKDAIHALPTLYLPKPGTPFVMFVTHDTQHVGGILTQQVDSIVRHISIYARVLDDYESEYTYAELERLAIVDSTRTFATYLVDNTMKIVLDPEKSYIRRLGDKPSVERIFGKWAGYMSDYQSELVFTKILGHLSSPLATALVPYEEDFTHPIPCRLEAHPTLDPSIQSPLNRDAEETPLPTHRDAPPTKTLRRGPTRRCTKSVRTTTYPGTSQIGRSRLGDDYQATIPILRAHNDGIINTTAWGKLDRYHYSVSIGSEESVTKYFQPLAYVHLRRSDDVETIGTLPFHRKDQRFHLTRTVRPSTGDMVPMEFSMVFVLQGKTMLNRVCLIPFAKTAPAEDVAHTMYSKVVTPLGEIVVDMYDYMPPPTDELVRSSALKPVIEFTQAVWMAFYAMAKARRTASEYYRIVTQLGQLIDSSRVEPIRHPRMPPSFIDIAVDTQHPTTTEFDRELDFESVDNPNISGKVDNQGPTSESPTLDMKRKREEPNNVEKDTKPSKQVKFKDEPGISPPLPLKLGRRDVTPFKP